MLEQEETEIVKSVKIQPVKLNKFQILKELEQRNHVSNLKNQLKTDEVPLEENLNHALGDRNVATTVDQAISLLQMKEHYEKDRNPEKRMKAAFKAYEEVQLPIAKSQYPSLKLSQLKQIIFKEWQKSAENPLNEIN